MEATLGKAPPHKPGVLFFGGFVWMDFWRSSTFWSAKRLQTWSFERDSISNPPVVGGMEG